MDVLNLPWRVFMMALMREQLQSRLHVKKVLEDKPEILQVRTGAGTFVVNFCKNSEENTNSVFWFAHQVAVKRPVFIIGHMRTGTTFLQWLMACDPTFRFVLLQEQF